MSTEPQDGVPDLKLPEWVPSVVRLAAAKIYERERKEGTLADLNLLNRLTSDERMKSVWRALGDKRYLKPDSTKTYVHPAYFYSISLAKYKRMKASELRRKGGNFNEATARLIQLQAGILNRQPDGAHASWSKQDCVIHLFFHSAYYLARNPQTLLSRAELKKILSGYSKAHHQLEELSETLRSFGMEGDAETLKRIALEVVKTASWIEVDAEDRGEVIVDRHRGDVFLRSYVVQLAKINRVMLGTPLNGTLATTANVALNLRKSPVKGEQVRQILRSVPDTGTGSEEVSIPWN